MGKYENTRSMTPKETEELERSYRQASDPAPRQAATPAPRQTGNPAPRQNPNQKPPKKKLTKKQLEQRRRIIIISSCAAVLLLLVGIVIWMVVAMNAETDDGRIYSNVYAANVNLGGMTEEEAKSALHLATDSTFTRKDMVVRVGEDSIVLSPEDTGAMLDVDAVVEAAYSYGRDGRTPDGSVHTIVLLPYLTLDTDFIKDTIDAFCASYSSVMTPYKVELEGERPEYNPEDPEEDVTHQTLTITMGTPEYKLDSSKLYDEVLDAYSMNQLSVTYEPPTLTEPERPDAEKLFEEYCVAPIDAVQNGETFEVTPEVWGYGFDVEKLTKDIADAAYGQQIKVVFGFLEPEFKTEDVDVVPFQDTLGTFAAINTVNNSENRNTNLQISCGELDGHIIQAGEEFSFNDLLGSLTSQKGYQKAPAIVGGQEVNTLGGGVSQTATALYYCALMADLEILERHNHTYAVTFAPLGFDANVERGSQDLRLRNNTGNPIRIRASASEGAVVITLEGTDNRSYKAELTYQIITELAPETIYQTMAKDNVLGYQDGDVLVEAITGYVIETTMTRVDKVSGAVISSRSIDISHYSKRDQQVVVLEPEPTLPTDPEVPTEPDIPTEPDVPTDPQAPTDPVAPTDPTDPPTPTETEVTQAPETEATEAPTEELPVLDVTEAPIEEPTEAPAAA